MPDKPTQSLNTLTATGVTPGSWFAPPEARQFVTTAPTHAPTACLILVWWSGFALHHRDDQLVAKEGTDLFVFTAWILLALYMRAATGGPFDNF